MLEKPDIAEGKIIACLAGEFGLTGAQVAFLPIGADLNTAVYRAEASDGTSYFVKLRSGVFEETTVTLPRYLRDQGIAAIIPPLPTRTGHLWANLDAYRLILYPFVQGRDGYEVNLSDRQWHDLGAVLRRVHTTVLTPALWALLQTEAYAPHWRESLKLFMERIEVDGFVEPVAEKAAAFMKARRSVVLDLIERADRLAGTLQRRSIELVLCHSDIHAGNVHVDDSGALYIVDWDNPILAPKERDLMYVGGGLMGGWRTPQEEVELFYQGYGPAQVDLYTLAYYRYERIIIDLAIYCDQLLMSSAGGQDREQSLRYLMSNFLPDHTIELAYRADPEVQYSITLPVI